MNDMDLMQGLLNLCCIAVPAITVISIGIVSRRRTGQVTALAATENGEASAPLATAQE
jgi:hypothetical protein